MTELYACHSVEDLGGGQFQNVHAIKPIAYSDKGIYRRNVLAYESNGTLDKPLVLDTAPLIAQIGNDASARFCPVREDLAAFVQFGVPQFKTGLTFAPVTNLSAASLSKAQAVSWDAPGYTMEWLHAGHYASWLLRAQKGWGRPSAIQFPVTVAGLTRTGDQFYRAGVPVCSLRSPVATDPADPENVVQLPYSWGKATLTIDTSGLKAGIPWEIDPTLVLQPDATAGKDTKVFRWDGYYSTYNYGLSPSVYPTNGTSNVNNRGLIYFSLLSIPATATCSSAAASMWRVGTPGSSWAETLYLHSITSANGGWIEGTKNNALAAAGEPCWNAKAADGAGGITTAWAGDTGADGGADAGCSVSGTDFDATELGSCAANRADIVGTQYIFNMIPTTKIGTWFGSDVLNYGLFLRGTTGNSLVEVALSDHATPAYRPQFTVIWSAAGGGGILKSGIFVSGIIYSGIVQ